MTMWSSPTMLQFRIIVLLAPNDNATGPLTIGEGSIIRSHTIVYEGSTLEKV